MRTIKISFLKFLDARITALNSWLYLKHTRLYISILAEEAKIAAPYPAPDEAEIHRTFEEMGMDYEELKATRHMTPAPKIRTT